MVLFFIVRVVINEIKRCDNPLMRLPRSSTLTLTGPIAWPLAAARLRISLNSERANLTPSFSVNIMFFY